MRKIYETGFRVLLLASILLTQKLNAQVSTYTFTQSSGAYVPVTGGITLDVASPSLTLDDAVYVQTIPFNFLFNNAVQTSVQISTNGFLTFGATAPGNNNYTPISSATAYAGAVSAFGRDLQGGYSTAVTRTSGSNSVTVSNVGPITIGSVLANFSTGFPDGTTVTNISGNTLTLSNNATSTGTNTGTAFYGPWSNIHVETIGTAPNRVFVVQWSNFRRFGTTLATTQDMKLNFQVRLYENDNSIEVVYGDCTPGATTFTTVNQVGLRGPNNTFATNVNNRLNVKGTNDNWLNSAVGTLNTSGMVFNNVAPANVIDNGLTYRWEAPACYAPSNLAVTTITSSSVNFSWSASIGAESYNIEYGTPGFTPGTGTELGSGSTAGTTFDFSGLTAETAYQIYISSDCGVNGNSTWIGPLNVFTGYCLPSSSNQNSWISQFTSTNAVANMNYSAASGAPGGYANLSATQLIQNYVGNPTNISLTAGGPTVGFAVWVDWNNNLTFEPAERMFNTTGYVTTTNGVINIPGGTPAGQYRMRVMCDFNNSNPSNPCATIIRGEFLDFTFEVVSVPVSPSLSQDPTPPTCDLGTEISASGSPEVDVVWYWQTDALGTSTSQEYTGPLAVYANGTYYLRAYHTVYNYWADASSIVISNFPLAPTPPTPVADLNPSCAPTGSQVTVDAAPVGTEFYWQSVENGTSTATPVSGALAITSSSTVYVAAFETSTGCWSNTSSLAITVDSYIPNAPSVGVNNFNICSGTTTQEVSVNPYPGNGSLNLSFGTNLQSPGPATSFPLTVPALPSGATITSAQLQLTNVNAINGSWRSEIRVATSGIYTLAQTQISTLTSGGLITPDPVIDLAGFPLGGGTLNLILSETFDDGGAGTIDATFGNVQLVINYTIPVTTSAWYDAPSNGNLLGTGSTFETVGSAILDNPATFGTYQFYAGGVSGGCQSATRTVITVNVADVNAELIPVDASCNGGENGSFALGTIECGDEPFMYSIDGGAYGAIPTDLTAGTYSVTIQDDNGFESAPITVVIGQPAPPANLTLVDANYFSADISWTTTGDETSWTVEYGPAGFTPGTGTEVVVFTNFTTLTELTENTAYQFYVTPNCGAGSVAAGPQNFTTNAGFFTFDNQCGPGFIDISNTADNTYSLGDDGEVGFTLPWTLNYQGTSVTNMTIGNNGGILFNTLVGQLGFTNGAMAAAADGLYPFWDDIGSNSTVRTQIQGTAPNRLAIFQWNGTHLGFGAGTPFVFQIIIEEATHEIYYIYDNVVTGSATYDFGASATIGAAGPNTDVQVSFNNVSYLQNNSCVHFYNALCPNPVLVSNQIFQEEVILDWNAGLYGETEWTIIYGPAGFDPETEGTTLSNLTSSDANIFGLTQLTDYDVYIYAECQLDDLTSPGLLVSFQTLPWCNNPTALAGTVAVDSLFATWNWTPVPGATNGGITSFNIQYGMTGFELNSGTVEVATGVDFADTVANPNFLAGGVYQYYVQAVCGVDTSNYSGPFTFVMPLTNDAVCSPEMLSADGTVYTFNNTGATVEAGESTIAPPATGANTETGWINSTVNNSTWFTFVAPASGSVRVDNTAINYNGQAAVYDAANCTDWTSFELIAANDNSMLSTSVAPNFSVCGLTPGATYYLMHDGFNATTGNYSISITPIVLNAGNLLEVIDLCSGGSVDLFDGIVGYDNGGVWTAELPSAGTQLNGSDWSSAGFAYQIFNFEYRLTNGCAFDTTFAKVRVWAPSNAGADGSITVCRNEPFDLLSGLNGTVDLGGTWYNPSLQPIASSAITASNIPGQFNYYYVAGNGVCPDDTALVLVNVSSSCNYLDVEELYFGTMTIMPNPSNGVFNINNIGSTEVFNYTVTDVDGRVILTKEAAINGTETTVVDLTDKVTGMYMIRVYNDNAEKVFRVIKQ